MPNLPMTREEGLKHVLPALNIIRSNFKCDTGEAVVRGLRLYLDRQTPEVAKALIDYHWDESVEDFHTSMQEFESKLDRWKRPINPNESDSSHRKYERLAIEIYYKLKAIERQVGAGKTASTTIEAIGPKREDRIPTGAPSAGLALENQQPREGLRPKKPLRAPRLGVDGRDPSKDHTEKRKRSVNNDDFFEDDTENPENDGKRRRQNLTTESTTGQSPSFLLKDMFTKMNQSIRIDSQYRFFKIYDDNTLNLLAEHCLMIIKKKAENEQQNFKQFFDATLQNLKQEFNVLQIFEDNSFALMDEQFDHSPWCTFLHECLPNKFPDTLEESTKKALAQIKREDDLKRMTKMPEPTPTKRNDFATTLTAKKAALVTPVIQENPSRKRRQDSPEIDSEMHDAGIAEPVPPKSQNNQNAPSIVHAAVPAHTNTFFRASTMSGPFQISYSHPANNITSSSHIEGPQQASHDPMEVVDQPNAPTQSNVSWQVPILQSQSPMGGTDRQGTSTMDVTFSEPPVEMDLSNTSAPTAKEDEATESNTVAAYGDEEMQDAQPSSTTGKFGEEIKLVPQQMLLNDQSLKWPAFEPPTFKPPTFKPPTFKPPTFKPPTFKPPTFKHPTFKPPTFKPPTFKPPTLHAMADGTSAVLSAAANSSEGPVARVSTVENAALPTLFPASKVSGDEEFDEYLGGDDDAGSLFEGDEGNCKFEGTQDEHEEQAREPMETAPTGTEAKKIELKKTESPETEPSGTKRTRAESPKTESTGTEVKKIELKKTKAPKTETTGTEAKEIELKKAETPKTETPNVKRTRTERTRTEPTKTEPTRTEPAETIPPSHVGADTGKSGVKSSATTSDMDPTLASREPCIPQSSKEAALEEELADLRASNRKLKAKITLQMSLSKKARSQRVQAAQRRKERNEKQKARWAKTKKENKDLRSEVKDLQKTVEDICKVLGMEAHKKHGKNTGKDKANVIPPHLKTQSSVGPPTGPLRSVEYTVAVPGLRNLGPFDMAVSRNPPVDRQNDSIWNPTLPGFSKPKAPEKVVIRNAKVDKFLDALTSRLDTVAPRPGTSFPAIAEFRSELLLDLNDDAVRSFYERRKKRDELSARDATALQSSGAQLIQNGVATELDAVQKRIVKYAESLKALANCAPRNETRRRAHRYFVKRMANELYKKLYERFMGITYLFGLNPIRQLPTSFEIVTGEDEEL